MKKLLFHGLALALGAVMVSPAAAQFGDSSNEFRDHYSNAYQTTTRTLRRPYQEQESPSDLGSAPGEPGMPTPIPGDQIAPSAPCGPTSGCGPNAGGCDTGCNNGVFSGSSSIVNKVLGCVGGGCGGRNSNSNWVAGIYGLGFARDYEDDFGLSYNATPAYLFSTDADHDFFGGVEFMLGKRNCDGRGWEFRYWGLYPTQADVSLANGRTVLNNLSQVTDPTSGNTVLSIYNNSTSHRIYRNNEFHNVEWNLLANAGCRGRRSYEWLAGFRWFEFDENFRYRTSTNVGGYPPVFDYDLDVSNTLLGFQMGGRKEICLGKGFRIHLGGKAGVFNNYIRHRQSMQNNLGVYAQINQGPLAGNDYNYASSKNDIAMMGELDLGMSWQFRDCWRLRGGYRAVGFSGVALAPDQIPVNFMDGPDASRINSNGSLILHGFYAGAEYCF